MADNENKTSSGFNIKKTWEKLNPDKKKKAVVFIVIGCMVLIAFLMYTVRKGSYTPQAKAVEKKKEISLEPKLLEKSQFSESQKTFKEFKDNLENISTRLDNMEKNKTTQAPTQTPPVPEQKGRSTSQEGQKSKMPPMKNVPGTASIPPPPVYKGFPEGQPPLPGSVPQARKTETYGEIEIISQRIEKDEKKDVDKKKASLKIYLPPSFMEATLLSGLAAPTSEGSQGQPAPVLIRIKDLAVLPNKVKANLKGCFLIAEGYGNLSDERAHLRLANLSCLSKKGQAVIDQKVKGFVVDNDGKIGLSGRIVAKFGSKIAMSLIAGFFGGLGDSLQNSASQTYYGAYGASQVIDTKDTTRAAVGGGLARASKDVQKFYLDLSKQTMPVVEVGAMKNITVVISEGTTLEVKERENACIGGEECER
jgi:conjugal transfer pilus assembly protein TraB